MGTYRKVEVKMWGDEHFRKLSALQPSGQALFIYLLTGPHTGSFPGLFKLGGAALAEELGWDYEVTGECIEEIEHCKDGGCPMLIYDRQARIMFLPAAMRYNKPESPNVARAWVRAWLDLPESPVKQQARTLAEGFLSTLDQSFAQAFREGFEKALPLPFVEGWGQASPNQNKNRTIALTRTEEDIARALYDHILATERFKIIDDEPIAIALKWAQAIIQATPDVDHQHEVDLAAAWCISNKKHYRNIMRFLGGWFNRAQADTQKRGKRSTKIKLTENHADYLEDQQ